MQWCQPCCLDTKEKMAPPKNVDSDMVKLTMAIEKVAPILGRAIGVPAWMRFRAEVVSSAKAKAGAYVAWEGSECFVAICAKTPLEAARQVVLSAWGNARVLTPPLTEQERMEIYAAFFLVDMDRPYPPNQ